LGHVEGSNAPKLLRNSIFIAEPQLIFNLIARGEFVRGTEYLSEVSATVVVAAKASASDAPKHVSQITEPSGADAVKLLA
jgi:hypothetical protein